MSYLGVGLPVTWHVIVIDWLSLMLIDFGSTVTFGKSGNTETNEMNIKLDSQTMDFSMKRFQEKLQKI